METVYVCPTCKHSKTVIGNDLPESVLCGDQGCYGRARPRLAETQCQSRRSGGWGVMMKCTFPMAHKGPHSWSVGL